LAFLGFGLPPGARGFAAWVGIPALVWPALIAQALVFGLVHVGKTPEELLTAFPGGLGLGMLTWRMRSVWPSVLLHVGTGAIILVTILLSR
jgi:membrane protease YdiL (CAAX protease family)